MKGNSWRRRMILAAGLLALMGGLALAGGEQVQQLNKDYPVGTGSVNNAPVNQGPAQLQNREGDRPGSVQPIPLDGLKAEKFKTNDGKEAWRVVIPGNRPLATPAVVDGMVYVGGGFGSYEFYAFDAATGEPKWAIKVSDDGPTAAVVAEGVVVFNTESCTLFVVDAKRGHMLWSRWLGDPLMSQPAIGEGKVFMAFPTNRGHALIALGLKDGKEAWRMPIKGDIISAPVVYKDSVYLTTFDGAVYRFRMKDGKEIWQKDFKATSAPWLYKEQVFVSQRDQNKENKPTEGVGRMESGAGKQNQASGAWRQRNAPYLDSKVQADTGYHTAQKANDSSVGFGNAPESAKIGAAQANVGQSTVQGLWEYQGSRPCVFKGKLFLTQGDQVVALDPDSGAELWVRDLSGDLAKIGGHLGAPPSPAGDKLYLATATGQIIILDQDKGRVIAALELGLPMRYQPAVAKGRLFVGTTTGVLIGVSLGDPSADGWTMWGGGPTHNGN